VLLMGAMVTGNLQTAPAKAILTAVDDIVV
jgi:hypothetical protein